MFTYYVYILANKKNGTLYTGVTNNLLRRVYEHKHKMADGFTKRYGIDKLVYYIQTDSIEWAIMREKQIKRWKRKWKLELIKEMNIGWNDLYYECGGTDDMFYEYFKEKKIMKELYGEDDNRV